MEMGVMDGLGPSPGAGYPWPLLAVVGVTMTTWTASSGRPAWMSECDDDGP